MQVKGHEDKWDLGRCGLPARTAWLVSRALWSAQQAARDARDDGGKALNKLTASTDEDDQVPFMDCSFRLCSPLYPYTCMCMCSSCARREGLRSGGAVQKNIYVDPTDPTKFFQQEDTGMKVC